VSFLWSYQEQSRRRSRLNDPLEHKSAAMVDSIQQYLATYASNLEFRDIDPPAIHAAKVRIIDNLGALIGGFHEEPCEIARKRGSSSPRLRRRDCSWYDH